MVEISDKTINGPFKITTGTHPKIYQVGEELQLVWQRKAIMDQRSIQEHTEMGNLNGILKLTSGA